MKKLIATLIFLSAINSANAATMQEMNPQSITASKVFDNPFIDAKMKVVNPLSLSVDQPLTLNTGVDIDLYDQLSELALMPANKPEITITGRKGANYEVETGDGFTWDMSIVGGKNSRIMPVGGKDRFKISCAAKTFGEDEEISKKMQQVTVIYDSKK